MENKPLSPKYDVVFKAIFGEESNIAILADFLEAVLELPKEEYEEIVIIDPHLLRETKADKLGILDLRIKTTHGHQISVEIQVSPQAAIWKRMQYYNARLLTSQIASGEAYTKINCAISVLISYPTLIEGDEAYHHCFKMFDQANKMVYPDSSEIHILEVQKAEKAKNAKDSALVNWLKFFAAETKEEFEMAAHTSSSIAKAWGIVQHLSGDEKARMIAEYEEMARRDQEDRLMGARREGELAGRREGELVGRREGELEANRMVARNLLKKSFSWDDVAEITGLSLNEIKELSQKNTH